MVMNSAHLDRKAGGGGMPLALCGSKDSSVYLLGWQEMDGLNFWWLSFSWRHKRWSCPLRLGDIVGCLRRFEVGIVENVCISQKDASIKGPVEVGIHESLVKPFLLAPSRLAVLSSLSIGKEKIEEFIYLGGRFY